MIISSLIAVVKRTTLAVVTFAESVGKKKPVAKEKGSYLSVVLTPE